MKARVVLFLGVALVLAGCGSFTRPDAPAHPSRMGRFLGLVSSCGCAKISPSRMQAEFPKAVQGRYSPADIEAMRGWVAFGLTEHYDNGTEICAEACSQHCAVESVAKALGAGTGGAACPITEGNLKLTPGLQYLE